MTHAGHHARRHDVRRTNPQAPRCFRTHHLQRISTGIVMADAAHILAEASKVKINMANRRFGQDITNTAQKA